MHEAVWNVLFNCNQERTLESLKHMIWLEACFGEINQTYVY